MAALTPVKISTGDQNCFLCGVTKDRTIKLTGRKSADEDVCEKLNTVLNDDLEFTKLKNVILASVCRSCFKNIEQTYEFILELRHTTNQFVRQSEGSVRVKRCANSPETPTPSQNVTVSRSRKQLRLQYPTEQVHYFDFQYIL